MLLLRRRNKASDSHDTPGDDSRELSADVRRGALWSIGSTILLRLASILTTAVVAHILNPRDFGVFAVALTAYAIISAIGELGVAACLVRADLDLDSLAPTMATISLATSAVLAFAMAAFARPIAAALGSAAAAGPVRVMALAVLLVGVFAVPGAQLVRDFKQDKLFIANVVGFVPSTVVVILLAKSGQGAMAFAWSRVAGQAFTGLVFILSVPKIYWPGFTRGALSLLVRFGLPLAGANFVNYILLNVDYALVGHLMGAVALGTYVLAFNVASWPSTLLSSMINNVSMPAFSRVQHDADLLRNTIASALRSLSLVVMPMCALIMALALPLVLTLYGTKWAASAEVLSVLTLYSAVSVICLLFANILAGLGRTTFLLVVQLVWLGALVPAMVLGVRQDGIVGAAYAHIAVIGPVVLPSYLLVLRRVTGVRFGALGKAVLPALLASSAAALAAGATASLLSLPLAQLVAGLAVGGLVYVIATAPLLIALIGQTTNPHALRILGVYAAAARLVGLSGAARPKHSAGSGRWREAQQAGAAGKAPVPAYQLFTPAGRPVSNASVQSTAAALNLLISLARPEPPAVPLARPEPRTVPMPRQRPMALAVPYERRNSQR
jgi:PST family polysaccharide transporter